MMDKGAGSFQTSLYGGRNLPRPLIGIGLTYPQKLSSANTFLIDVRHLKEITSEKEGSQKLSMKTLL